jgi:hypothetical protein
MRSLIRKAAGVRAQGPWIFAAVVLAALIVAPFAGAFGDGKTMRGGARNPSPDARRAYAKETEIIANVSTYGTRQSNKSNNGGGAVYGCRSAAGGTPKGNEPCLRASHRPERRQGRRQGRDRAAGEVRLGQWGGRRAEPEQPRGEVRFANERGQLQRHIRCRREQVRAHGNGLWGNGRRGDDRAGRHRGHGHGAHVRPLGRRRGRPLVRPDGHVLAD